MTSISTIPSRNKEELRAQGDFLVFASPRLESKRATISSGIPFLYLPPPPPPPRGKAVLIVTLRLFFTEQW
ncbi:hypothetical protein KY289_003623 [Solanum tuberosum]|nr:hypothetical protein KY284_003522 [Solanum tuberosum]KAH0732435.1 hypothetical protein KY289_003623 [Solanum tuberosum]